VVCGAELELNPVKFKQFLLECTHRYSIWIRDNRVREAMELDDVVHE
jgi:hypothetical protein